MSEKYVSREKSIDAHFEAYSFSTADALSVLDGLSKILSLNLIRSEVMKHVRVVSYDATYYYIFSQGQHVSTGDISVEKIPVSPNSEFHLYRIPHEGRVGKQKEDYASARAWLLDTVIEETAVNAKKRPNDNFLFEPDLEQPIHVLDTVMIPPPNAFKDIQKNSYNYITDILVHELAHIEQREIEGWNFGDEALAFPSEEQKEQFIEVIARSKLVPTECIETIIESIDRNVIGEMYAFLIDREAKRKILAEDFSKDILRVQKFLSIFSEQTVMSYKDLLSDPHVSGKILVYILEELYPIYEERKKFIEACLVRYK